MVSQPEHMRQKGKPEEKPLKEDNGVHTREEKETMTG
jgi:hypothetical protein